MDDEIIEFLIRANKATYAGGGKQAPPSRPDSHDLHYAEGNLEYIDSYLGGGKFAGEEALWKDGLPFWSMNYAGRVLSDRFSGDFLKEVLSAVTREYPFRGPLAYQSGPYSYRCRVEGDFEWFLGSEEILCGGLRVYECNFHGGRIE